MPVEGHCRVLDGRWLRDRLCDSLSQEPARLQGSALEAQLSVAGEFAGVRGASRPCAVELAAV